MDFFGSEPQQAVVPGCLPERNVFGGGIGSKIRAGKSTANYFRFGRTRIYASGNTPRAKTRKTAGAGRWVWSESAATEHPRCFQYLEQGDLQETL